MKSNNAKEMMVNSQPATRGGTVVLTRSIDGTGLPILYDWRWDALGLIARIAAVWLIALYFPVPFVPTR